MILPILKKLQEQFISELYAEDPPVDLLDPKGLYRSSYRRELLQTLEAVYPLCAKENAEDYIVAHRMTSPDLSDYAQGFAAWMGSDLARLEWACYQALRGPMEPILKVDLLAQVPEIKQPNLIFQLTSSFCLLRCHSQEMKAAYTYWAAWHKREEAHENKGMQDTHLLVWCYQGRLCFEFVDETALLWFQGLENKQTLGELTEVLVSQNLGDKLENLLRMTVHRGMLIGFMVY